MKKIRENIEKLNSNIQKVECEEYKNIFGNITSVLDDLSNKIEELMMNQAVLAENINCLDDDVSDIQEELFEEVSLEELEEIEEEYKEINCVHCGKPIYIECSALEEKENIPCPYCGKDII